VPDLPEGITLREATPADEAFLRDVYADMRATELAPLAWPAAAQRAFCDMQYTLQDRHYREHYPGAAFLVIDEHRTPVGRMIVHRSARQVRLMDIAILSARRGRGIGGALVRALADEADRDGREMVLHVERDNPVRNLYARLGFVEREPVGVYIRMTRPPAATRGG
jgi:GNAT superfamily N-acetyltransferase